MHLKKWEAGHGSSFHVKRVSPQGPRRLLAIITECHEPWSLSETFLQGFPFPHYLRDFIYSRWGVMHNHREDRSVGWEWREEYNVLYSKVSRNQIWSLIFTVVYSAVRTWKCFSLEYTAKNFLALIVLSRLGFPSAIISKCNFTKLWASVSTQQ